LDYDRTEIAARYDAGRSYAPEVMQLWLTAISRHLPTAQVRDVVDIGSGTGRYSQALASHFGARVTGVEPSARMLSEARAKTAGGTTFLQGRAEDLPLPDGSADLAFLSMVFHHLADAPAAARECRRVLRPSCHVVLRNGTAEQAGRYPHVRFFAGIRDVIAERLPSAMQVRAAFEGNGFELAAHEIVVHPMAPSLTDLAAKFRHRVDSMLVALADEVFEAGMARLMQHAENAERDEPPVQNVDLFVFRALA